MRRVLILSVIESHFCTNNYVNKSRPRETEVLLPSENKTFLRLKNRKEKNYSPYKANPNYDSLKKLYYNIFT